MAPDSSQNVQTEMGKGEAKRDRSKLTLEIGDLPEPKSFRTSLPQVLATMAQSMLLLSLGMMVFAPAVINGELRKVPKHTNSTQNDFYLTDSQQSWFAGLIFIVQPIGSVLSGFAQAALGRKKCMLMVNLPQLLGWLLVYHANSVPMLFTAAAFMGFSIGFMEAPTFSYVGEISQAHLRGMLASFTSVYISTGLLVMCLLGSFTNYKTAAAISTCVPVIAFVAILQVPESPVWLLTKGRREEARAALAWLRGWVKQEVVLREFRRMESNAEASKLNSPITTPLTPPGLAYSPVPANEGGLILEDYKPTFAEKMKDLIRPEMLKPLGLVVCYFGFLHCAAFNGSRPFMVYIFEKLGVPLETFVATVFAASSQILGSFVCMGSVRKVGKRGLSLISITACSLITLCLGVYAYLRETRGLDLGIFPLVLFSLLFFCTNVGIGVVPWTLLAEVFPARGRGVGGGVAAASYYVWYFIVTKTFLDIVSYIQLYGIFFLYSALGFCGLLFLYIYLPETEGKKLEDIEKHFQSKKNKELES